ncbi:MAG: hypothetical protein ABSE49_05420 [Polyangiaceae bacterium]
MTGLASASGTSSLRVGERLIAWSDDGLLAAEYALFDATEIVLHASDPVTVREAGYMTTAKQALERLAALGVSAELASEAARALSRDVVLSFARGATSRAVVAELGAQEVFDGAIYRASPEIQCYEGTWLDLRNFSPLVSLPSAPLLLQALHLAATLSEVSGDTSLHLSTAGTMRGRRPGERTYMRPPLKGVEEMPKVLRKLRPRTLPLDADPAREARLHPALLARVRERLTKDAPPRLRAHLQVLDRTLSGLAKAAGHMADEELRAIERQLDESDLRDVAEWIQRIERVRGNIPAIRYLQARLALLRGDEPPVSVAKKLSEIADEEQGFHQASLVAARTWLAAGEEGHARYFAHKLVDDPTASDSERLVALEILATVPANTVPSTPSIKAEIVDEIPATARLPRPPRLLGLGNVPLPQTTPAQTVPPPPYAPNNNNAAPPPARPLALYIPELVESLPLPPGANESDLGVNERPTTPTRARITMVRLARDLARDYRLWYGKTLRCDVMAIDAMQQHLTQRYVGADITEEPVAWELRRHGALLTEVIARKLGGSWIDVGPSEPGYWAMLVPPGTRTHPIARVYRYVSLGQRERDLVAYFIELEDRMRNAGG